MNEKKLTGHSVDSSEPRQGTGKDRAQRENEAARRRQAGEDLHLADPRRVSGDGRAGGNLARDKGTEDEEKRAFERPASATRVRKSDEKDG